MSEEAIAETVVYTVPEIHCEHCERAITEEVSAVEGFAEIAVDLESKRVTVRGRNLDDLALRAAIAKAGYETE